MANYQAGNPAGRPATDLSNHSAIHSAHSASSGTGSKEEALEQGQEPLHQVIVEDIAARERHYWGVQLLAPAVELPMFAFHCGFFVVLCHHLELSKTSYPLRHSFILFA